MHGARDAGSASITSDKLGEIRPNAQVAENPKRRTEFVSSVTFLWILR